MFVKGQSGNPAGRPKNCGVIAELRGSINKHVPEIIEKLVIAAKAGDVQAAKLLLERVVPPVKSTEEKVQFSLIENGDLTEQGKAILQAASEGELTPTQAGSLLSGLGTLAKIKEIDELEKRITALENNHEQIDSESE